MLYINFSQNWSQPSTHTQHTLHLTTHTFLRYTSPGHHIVLTHTHYLYHTDSIIYLIFTEWHTFPHHVTHHTFSPPPSLTTTTQWNKYTLSLIPHALSTILTRLSYCTTFTTRNTLHPTNQLIYHRASHTLTASNNNILVLLQYYNSPLIIAIEGSYYAPLTADIFPPTPPHTTITGRATASTVILVINNTSQDDMLFHKPTIPLLRW